MAEADAEHRLLADELLDFFHTARHVGGVAGAIRQEDAVGVQREDVFRFRVRRHDGQLATFVMHRFQNVALDAEIHGDDVRRFFLVAFDRVGLRRRDFGDDGCFQRHGEQVVLLLLRRVIRDNDAFHRAGIADFPRDSARVDIVEARHALCSQEVRKALFIMPVRAVRGELADDEAMHEGLARLHEDVSDAVVADERIRQRQNLAAVRRVGQAFLIADHAGVEYDFARGRRFIQEIPREDAAVFEDEFSF